MSSEQDAVILGIAVQRATDRLGEVAENTRKRSEEYVAKVQEMKAELERNAAIEVPDFVPPERHQFADVLDKEWGDKPLLSPEELLEKARQRNAEIAAARQQLERQSERPHVSAPKRERMTFDTSVDENTHDKSNDRDDYGLEF